MSLPAIISDFLRDEAYLFLARKSLEEALQKTTAEAELVKSTRPPFGLLATRKYKETFEHSLRTVLDTKTAIENRLDKVRTLESWAKAMLEEELNRFLTAQTEEYKRSEPLLTAITEWERAIPTYSDQMMAFARDLRNYSRTIGVHGANPRVALEARITALAELRATAMSVDRMIVRFEIICNQIVRIGTNTLYQEVRLPMPPFVGVTVWVDQLGKMGDAQALATANPVDDDIRLKIANGFADMKLTATAARNAIASFKRSYLEKYWNQLREYALSHYVEDRDVDDVLKEISERHAAETIRRTQAKLAEERDPFKAER